MEKRKIHHTGLNKSVLSFKRRSRAPSQLTHLMFLLTNKEVKYVK